MTMEKKFRFALVGHSEELAEAVRRCINPEIEEVAINVVKMGQSLPVAKKLVDEGTEIIFGHMGNAHLMFQEIGQPVVEILRTHLDMMMAFVEAKQFNSRIGLTSFASPTDGIEFIEKTLGITVHQIIFTTFDEMEQGIHDAYGKGMRVMVGGGVSSKIIASLGGRGIVIKPRKSVVEKAFREARAIASLRRREAESSARVKTILQMVDDGVIGVDNFGRVDIYNETAEKILGMDLKKWVGQAQTKILKEINLLDVLTSGRTETDVIKRIGRNNIVVNALPIHIDGRSQGAVALFKNVSRIESINRKLKEDLYFKGFVAKHRIEDIIGESEPMRRMKKKLRQYAGTHATIMLQGETGTGKELAAQAIHHISPRSRHPFVAINCAALPETLLESELFGYEEGAFTGARRGGKIGLFELADGGTVFLDEIADVSMGLQVRLLRVIENKEVMRVGGDRYVPVDVRILSSSYKDLRYESRKGRFRPDLYYRLAVLKLKLPALRNKKEDIAPIVQEVVARKGKMPESFTSAMLNDLNRHNWPGNVRELISFVESYLILLGGAKRNRKLFDILLAEQLEELPDNAPPMPVSTVEQNSVSLSGEMVTDTLKKMLEKYERRLISDTLKACRFNKKETAGRLGVSVNTLWRKLNKGDPIDYK